MDEFEACLLDLNSFYHDPVKAEDIIRRIPQFFAEERQDSSVDLLLFLVFGENGITSFIRKALTSEESKYNILKSFELLEFLLVNYESRCVSFAEDVRKLCWSVAQCNVPSKVKENAMKLLKCVFAPSLVVALDLSNTMTTIRKYLEERVPPTVQNQVFGVIGMIFERVPEICQGEEDGFLRIFLRKMKQASKGSGTVVAGCFDGIYGYLVKFSLADDDIKEIYGYLKTYCDLTGGQTRYAAGRSALRVVRRHYRIFKTNIYRNIRDWMRALDGWLRRTGEDRQLGFSGLVSVYRAVALEVESSQSGEDRRNVEDIIESLLQRKDLMSVIGLTELISCVNVREDLTNRALQLIIRPVHEAKRGGLTYLSANLECLSKYLSRSPSVKLAYLNHLRAIAVALIDGYPEIETHFQAHSLQALELSFYHMARNGRHQFDEYLKDVIYQGLIRSCSHPIWTDVELQKEITGKEVPSHKSYLPLWLHITNLFNSNTEVDEHFEGRSSVAGKVLDEYVSSFLTINQKLDLRVEVKNPHVTDPGLAAEAVRPKDFLIFINNVSLFEDVVEGTEDLDGLRKWLARIFAETVDSSNRSPLVSGFYKVLTVALKIADRVRFFDLPENGECCALLRRFLRDVSTRVGQYKGDLQISCFRALLSAPVRLIESMVRGFVPMFKVILRVGSGHFPLLRDCLAALERWYNELPKDSIEFFLRGILPHFDLFLQSSGRRDWSGDLSELKLKPLKVRSQVRRVHFMETESQLLIIQRKFLFFLGRLDQDVCEQIIRPVEDGEEEEDGVEVEGGCGRQLTYDLPLVDTKLRLHMEELLPRVMDLSLSSSNRSTRVTACEFLHSATLLTLGAMKRVSGELNAAFRKLATVSFVLGCDSDPVVAQIFQPLAMQMVRYFSDGERVVSEVQIFVNCLMQAVSHPHNTSLRDFAARLIREFTEWSMKALSWDVPNNVNAVLRSMYSLSVHPDHDKRRGAAIVFNNIYPLIRGEAHVLNTQWYLLYYHFMECLSMCAEHHDTTHITNAIEHIRAQLTEKDFTEKVASQEVPPGFKGTALPCLMEWTFTRCCDSHTKIRKVSMGMIEHLSRSSPHYRTVKLFIMGCIQNVQMKPEYLKDNADEEEYLSWLRYSASLFDYYGWLLRHDAVTESDLKTGLVDHLMRAFVDRVDAPASCSDLVASKKAVAIVRMLEFLNSSLGRGIVWCGPEILRLITVCLYRPSQLRLELCDLEDREKLATTVRSLVSTLRSDQFFKLGEYYPSFSRLGERLRSRESLRESVEFANGLKVVWQLGLWGELDRTIRGDDVVTMLCDSVFEVKRGRCYGVTIDPNDRIFLAGLMRFGLQLGVSVVGVLDLVRSEEEIVLLETFDRFNKGEFFFELFRDELLDHCVSNSAEALDAVLNGVPTHALGVVLQMLKHASRCGLTSSAKERFVSDLCRRWTRLMGLSAEGDGATTMLVIVKEVCEVSPKALAAESAICSWLYDLMSRRSITKDGEAIFELLPFLSVVNEDENAKLTVALRALLTNLKQTSGSDCNIATAYRGLLNNFARTKSLPVLRETINLLREQPGLMKESDIERIFSDGGEVPTEHAKKLLNFLFEELLREDNAVCEGFLQEFLRKCNGEVAWDFLLVKFDHLIEVLQQGDIPHRISALNVVQTCTVRAKREEIERLPAGTKTAFKTLISICLKNDGPSSSEEEEMRRKCACCRFNTLCTVISVISSNPEQYRALIFKDDFPFLPHLINRSRKWELRMDFEEVPKRRKVLTTIRRTITRERQLTSGATVNSVKYLQDETLFESSLREDVTKFDFSYSLVRPSPKVDDARFHMDLEMDDLNRHECMATLVGLVEHMVDEEIARGDGHSLPFWLSAIMRRMKSFDSSVNDRIFLLKLLYNLGEYIRPYAPAIVPDLLTALLEVFQGKPVNYLVMDLVSLILGWKLDLSVVGGRAPFTQLAIYIVERSDSYRKDIINSNLELAKLVIEACRDNLNGEKLSAKAFERLKTGADGSDSYAVGFLNFHFCDILLANTIPAWTENGEEEFLQLVLRHCSGEDKNRKLAAEVGGLTLRHLARKGHPNLEKFVQMVRDKIHQAVVANGASDLSLLYAVHKNYPEIASGFVSTLQTCAWTVHGPFKVQSLEMLLAHVKRSDVLSSDFVDSKICTFLSDMLIPNDFEALALSLKIAQHILGRPVGGERMRGVAEKALTFADCRNGKVRGAVYDIAVMLYERWGDQGEEVIRQCKVVLLKGMNDSDSELSERCLEFWYGRTRGRTSTERFSEVLCELYSPETESGFLNFAARLMIRFAASADDYKTFIFEHPLATNNPLRRRDILKTSQCSMTAPMFAQTLTSQLSQPGMLQTLMTAPSGSSLLQTQLFQLEETAASNAGEDRDRKRRKERRFVRNVEKVRAAFARRHIVRRKAELEETRDRRRKLDEEVDILNEYTDGEYPDVQITHSHVLRPLEVLTRKDPQVSRHFLTALYDGFVGKMADAGGRARESETKAAYLKIGRLVKQVLEESENSDPTVVAFLFHVLLRCEGRLEADPGCVSKFAKSSGWLSVGGLVIEEMINSRRGVNREEMRWLSLAETARCLKEFEVLRGIFLDKLRVVDDVIEAIRAESVSDWSRAAARYESVIMRPPDDSVRNDFYVDAYLNSLARLSDWTKLNACVRGTYDLEDLWSDLPLFEKVLPWFLKSEAVMSLRSGDSALMDLVREVQQDPDKEREMKKFFLEELAVAHFASGSHQWMNYYLHQMCLNFLSTWSHWNKWSNNLRSSRLMQLRLMSELDQFRLLLRGREENDRADGLALAWLRNLPQDSDDLMNWDMRLTCRGRFLSMLLSERPDVDTTDIRKSLVRSEFELVRSGIAQRNVQLSREYLRIVEGRLGSRGDHNLRLMHAYYRSSLEILEEVGGTDANVRLRKLVDVTHQLEREMSGVMDSNDDDHGRFFFECNTTLGRVMRMLSLALGEVSEEAKAYAAEQLNLPRGDVKGGIEEKELEYLENARRIIEGADEDLLGRTYLEMAKYHRRSGSYSRQLARCLFRAMSLGNAEAKRLFCCLLNEKDLARDWTRDSELRRSCDEVPVWMFLQWTNQLLANLDSAMFPFVRDLLQPLSEEYPNALRFSFALSRENYKFRHGEFGRECRRFVADLERRLVSDDAHRSFLTALSYVAPPDLVVKHDLGKVLVEVNRSEPNWEWVVETVRDLRSRAFGDEYQPFRGSVYDGLLGLKSQLDALLQLKREKAAWVDKIRSMTRGLSKVTLRDDLKSYSPWLQRYQSRNPNTELEVPGQYDGEQRPILRHHVTISSFKHGVLVMNSKCKPIRISILGDDARVYKFLVKFGEDLRQDQRIQQVFREVNHVLAGNPQTARLSIDTYKVIPVKCNLGLIEWVNNTSSLHGLLTKSNPAVRETMERVQQEHLEFLSQGGNVATSIDAHLNGYLRVDSNRAVARFDERVHSFEWDLLRKAFWRLSSYPEQFVYLRRNFAVSQAVIYVAHWLAGIGDRHLDNTLVSSRTGRAVGIDFGCAFGHATEFLTPPEIVPFRLTPQIVNLMKPLGESGLIKETMVRCLRSLRRDNSALLAALEVFALEPALDWLEKARRDEKSRRESGAEVEEVWSPRQKIGKVRDKLEGASPVKIFTEDLVSGHSNSRYLERYLEVLNGGGVRSRFAGTLTEEEQVECLIDLATDRHVLCKTYVGWNPWL